MPIKGDLGIQNKSGAIEYHGRADRQVKVGGVRIELGEIEAVTLRCFPALLNVAVEKMNDRLVGVAAPRPGEPLPTVQEVKEALSSEVPAAYVPGEWHFRDALPLGSAGKVDHNLVTAWLKEQNKASMWGAIYDEVRLVHSVVERIPPKPPFFFFLFLLHLLYARLL